jgi:PAS domain S-box-containing protein
MAEPRVRIMIADDDRLFRDALADLISGQPSLELVGEAVDHPDAIRLAVKTRPQVVVLDARMPGGNATTTVRAIREHTPGVEVLVLSAYEDAQGTVELLNAGAAGYLVKGVADEEILQGVTRAVRGQLSISTSLAMECVRLLRGQVENGRRAQASTLHDVNVLRQLLDRVPFAALLVARGGRIELANARVQELFGYRRTDLVGEHITRVVAQFQPGEPADEHIGRLLNRESPEEDVPEARFITAARLKSGAELPVEISVNRLSLGLSGVAVFFRDLSESRSAEYRYRELFSSSPDATVVIDPAGTILQVNAATERMFGFPAGEVVGNSAGMLLPGHPIFYRRESDELPARLGGPGGGEGLELVGRRRDGSQFPVDMSIGRVGTDDDRQVILSIRDMTEIAGSRAALERGVESLRTTNQQHRNTIVELVRSQERERMRVAAGIHDDSLQVITAAALRLQQLRRRLDDPDDLKILSKLDETIKLAADRLRNMIFDFRPPALEQDGLVAALGVYLDQLRADTGVEYELDSMIGEEPSEETRVVIYRIAQEALMNVRKHAHARRVRVRLSQVDDGLLTEIVDDGVGSDPLQADQISGHLGLTLMRDRAEIVGGWCRIEGAPGAGTTVEFWVPRGAGATRGEG